MLHHTKKSGADEILKRLASQNVVIVGVSAGAILLGPHIKIVQFFTPQMNTLGIEDLSALSDNIIIHILHIRKSPSHNALLAALTSGKTPLSDSIAHS